MAETIFFSWQADTPTNTGRNFLERALERALERLKRELELDEPERDELILDRDTKGVPGQPPIVETIFKKIDAAAVFVPDLTFVGKRTDGRPTPNPNVLIEYGWALKSRGHGRIVPVMNTAFGEPISDAMPFDMRHLRNPITYHLREGAPDGERKAEQLRLTKDLEGALKAVLQAESNGISDEEPATQDYQPVPSAGHGISRFRLSGLPLGIVDDEWGKAGDILMRDGPVVWARLMPTINPGRTWTIPELRKAASAPGKMLRQLFVSGSFREVRADDGYGYFVQENDKPLAWSVTFAFEAGEVWSIDSRVIPHLAGYTGGKPGLPVKEFEQAFVLAMTSFAEFLSRLGIAPPYRWIIGVEGIRTFGLLYDPPPGHRWVTQDSRGACVANLITEEGTIEGTNFTVDAIRPFSRKLFAKCALEWPEYLDQKKSES
jgi:hypothetical protein